VCKGVNDINTQHNELAMGFNATKLVFEFDLEIATVFALELVEKESAASLGVLNLNVRLLREFFSVQVPLDLDGVPADERHPEGGLLALLHD